jgi:SepF-like predicted cell division protein (DUF552 family)
VLWKKYKANFLYSSNHLKLYNWTVIKNCMPMNKLRNRFGRILKNPGDVILTEDYVELNQEARKKHAPRILVRTFRLHDFESVKEILDSIREGYTIGLINMLPLKDKDSIGLKRAIDKLKKTIEANDGDIAAFGEHWLVVTPGIAKVYRASMAKAEEAEGMEDGTSEPVQPY